MDTYEENGFVRIPFAPKYFIHPSGKIIHAHLNREIIPIVNEKGNSLVTLSVFGGMQTRFQLPRLIAQVFIPIPDNLKHLKEEQLVTKFLDGNKQNIRAGNIGWTTVSDKMSTAYANIRNSWVTKHPLPIFNEINTGLYPNPVPCLERPGFYYIPLYRTHIVINRNGDVFHLGKGKEQPTYPDPRGYLWTIVIAGADNTSRREPIHRLVAMLFCQIPEHHRGKSFDDLQVNHKDGNKSNPHYTNLEWVDCMENVAHAIENGLTARDIRVISRNIHTEEITRYRSIAHAARIAGVERSAMFNHLSSKLAGRCIVNDEVYKLDDWSEWPIEILEPDEEEWPLRAGGGVVALNIVTKQAHVTNTIKHACEILQLNFSKVITKRKYHGVEHPYQDWIFMPLEEYIEKLKQGLFK